MPEQRRRASHAGSWYDASADSLAESLTAWLAEARGASQPVADLHAVIAPHAGYSYSGPTAADAYAAVDPASFERVFILGPSHHVYLRDRCAVSGAQSLETPLGALDVDTGIVAQLAGGVPGHEGAVFGRMDPDMDEAEHSIEMHLPYIRQVFSDSPVKVIPIVVGSLGEQKERDFGRALAPWLADGRSLFVISSDFCHWGARFAFNRVDREGGQIWESIERLDRKGMRCIEGGIHAQYAQYQRQTENTVCGRHPIGVLMSALEQRSQTLQRRFSTSFVRYAQSSQVRSMSDSSVSYASAWVQAAEHL